MAKKISGKLLSVILVLAICCSTVFGCLITVSAQTSWLSFGTGKANNDFTQAEIELTVNPADIIDNLVAYDMGGIYTAVVYLEYDTDALSLSGATFVSGIDINGQDSSEGGCVFAGDNVNFMANDNDDTVYFKQVKIKLTFDILSEDVDNGQKYTVTATGATVTGPFDSDYDTTIAASGTIVVGCAHEIEGVGEPIADTVNGYEVYTDSECKFCQIPFGPQAIPTKLPSKTIYWSGEVGTMPTATDANGTYIIRTAEELAYIALGATADETKGKSFKIADGIESIILQPETVVDGEKLMGLSSYSDVQSYLDTCSGLKNWGITSNDSYDGFEGTFDGNGATVYGAYVTTATTYSGLFSRTKGEVTIKNINVSNSRFVGKRAAGGIVGYHAADEKITVTVEKCSVTNSYLETQGIGYCYGVGAIMGYGASAPAQREKNDQVDYNGDGDMEDTIYQDCPYIIKNCFVNLDEAYFVSLNEGGSATGYQVCHGGIAGVLGSNAAEMSDCVVIGIKPYSTSISTDQNDVQHTGTEENFTNIYTTEDVVINPVYLGGTLTNRNFTGKIFPLTDAQMQGATAVDNMSLDWDVWETNDGDYPSIKHTAEHNIADTSEFGLRMLATNLTYNTNGSYNINFYYRPSQTGGNDYNPLLYVTQLSEDGTYLGSFNELEGDVLTADEAAAVDGLKVGDIRYTIDRLSAREIYNKMVATAIVVKEEDGDNAAIWGESTDLSIADYAQKVLDGEGYYGENSEQYKTADQNLAQAVLKYGEAAYTALNTSSSTEGDTIYWEKATDKTEPTEIVDGVYIINTAAELAYIACAGPDETANKSYKVADNISKIVLQPEAYGDAIIALQSTAEVQEYFTNTEKIPSPLTWAGCVGWTSKPTYDFCGNFDGNGVEIYGMYHSGSKYAGLFGLVDGDVTIKNVTIKNAYIKNNIDSNGGKYRAGVIVGHTLNVSAANGGKYDTDVNTVSINRCTVTNCYIGIEQDVYNDVGVIAGLVSHERFMINNCLVYGNEAYYNLGGEPKAASLVGQASTATADANGNAYNTVKNSVILGTTPYSATYSDRSDNATNCFFNVYTDKPTQNVAFTNTTVSYAETAIKQITDLESIKGMDAMTNMPALDWENTWCYTSGYPTLAAPDYVAAEKIVYWSGNIGTMPTEIADDGAYIINTAEEMAYVILNAGVTNTVGKTFRIADDIDKIVLQPRGVLDLSEYMTLSSGTAVQDYLENTVGLSNLKNWNTQYAVFDGNFDGNGVEIYGLYGTGAYAGLFPTVDGGKVYSSYDNTDPYVQRDEVGITISGITVKNAYLVSSNRLAGLICQGYNSGGANVYGTVNIDTCGVINSYIKNTVRAYDTGYSGIITADFGSDIIKINNCLVYGNDATDLNGNNLYIRAGMINYLPVLDDEGNKTSTLINNTVTNSIILGTSPYNKTDAGHRKWRPECFSNVFTDAPAGTITLDNGAGTIKYETSQIEHVELDEITGTNAKDIVKTLNGDATTPVWYVGNGTYPGFREAGDMIAGAQIAYDSIIITDDCADNYGTTTDDNLAIYATSLNLKTNPYLAFTFVFNSEYITTRNKIVITFTTASGTYTTTPPEYVAGQYINKVWDTDGNGNWTNNKGAGRYHLYRFENIPVGDISSPIKITITYDGKTMVDGASLSLQGFAYECANAYKQTASDYYDALLEATKSLILYSQMVQARYGAKSS